jgi:cGMP-dependent protein kinase 1
MGCACSGFCSSEAPGQPVDQPMSPLIEEEKEKLPETQSKRKPKKKIMKRKKIENVTEVQTAKIVNRLKSDSDIKTILSAMDLHFFLKDLDLNCKKKIIESMKSYLLDPKEFVYCQGRSGECFFVVSSGKLEILVDNTRQGIIQQGEGFGELALIDDRSREFSVRTLERTGLWGIDRYSYNNIIALQSSIDFKENIEILSSVSIFSQLTNEEKEAVLSLATTQNFSSGEVIIKEGDLGDTLHIIKAGEVSVFQNDILRRKMTKGSYYGEQAIINNSARTATIIAATEVSVLVIKRDSVVELFHTGIEEVIFTNTIRTTLQKSSLIKDFANIQEIIKSAKIVKYIAGDIVIKENTKKNTKIFIVLKGKLTHSKGDIELYDIIGEKDVKSNSKSKFSENIIAAVDSVVAEVSKKSIESSMGTRVKKFSNYNDLLKIVQKVTIFRYLTNQKIRSLINTITEKSFNDKEVIINEGEIGDKLFIIKNGSVNILKNNEIIRTLHANNYFGERALMYNEKRSATVASIGNTICWIINKTDFDTIVNNRLHEVFAKRIELQDDSITLEDLVPVKPIGKGTFGNVILCAHREKKSLYALKCITRQKISAYEIYENTLAEKNILMQSDHLMVVKLVKTFKDNLRLYYLMEYIEGTDLFELQGKLSFFTIEDSKFYISSLLLLLEYLHNNNVIYRDLKPENVMIDEEGYTKLIDFGSAKIIQGKTYTIIGSPHYMAPEIMMGTGYTNSIDWWSLGIVLYEMLEGQVPFGYHEEDPVSVYKKVIERDLVFKKTTCIDTRALITQLLSAKPGIRNRGNTEKLKTHEYFNDIKWEQILSRQIKPNYIPKSIDMAKDISLAFKARRTLKDILSREETQDMLLRRNSKLNIPLNWDSNF